MRHPSTMVRTALLLCAFFVAASISSMARDWRIADFRASIVIDENGSAAVTERITLVFTGLFQGINRTIPVDYPGPRGTNYALLLDVERVRDGSGNALKHEVRRKGAYQNIKIYIPGAEDTTKTIEITYRTPNAVRWFDNGDEFYWNVTGNDWPVPIDHASAVVVLPQPATGGTVRAQAFTGVYGSKTQMATTRVDGNNAFFETTEPLPMRGGLTVDVFIPKGLLNEPSALTKAGWFLRGNSILFLPLVALAVMWPLWWHKGRDPRAESSVAPMYEPPRDMSPAEVGVLADDRIDPRDITSTVVDLAVRGYVKIEHNENKVLLWTTDEYKLHLLKEEPWEGLRPHERTLLKHLFELGNPVALKALKNRFYKAVPGIRKQIMSELKSKGMYTVDPNSAGAYVVVAAILIGLPFVVLDRLGIVNFFNAPLTAALAIAAAAIIVLGFGYFMTAKSKRGVNTRVHILGFQEFMDRVESDRLRLMPKDTFEKFLPFAMALGVEEHWAEAFSGILAEPPRWYAGPSHGYGGFHPVGFSREMRSMSSDMHQAFVSAPRGSSSGSGFGSGGGGFSGGGFGGGGGSAF